MFNLRTINVDIQKEVAYVQTGATLGELYYAISQKSKVHAFPAGVCPTVGVGGHIGCGGYGTLIRKYGLSIDNIVDAEIVDAKGRLLNRKSMGEDLFWAIGGGSASFGVVLSYTKTLEENATDFVVQWQQVAPTIDIRLFMRLLLQPIASTTVKGTTTIKASVVAVFLGSAAELLGIVGKEFPLLGLKKEDCLEMSWINSVIWYNDAEALKAGAKPESVLDRHLNWVRSGKRKSDYVQKPISKDALELIWKKMIELGNVGFVFNPYGGKMAEVLPEATPIPYRAGNLFKLQLSASWKDPAPNATLEYLNQANHLYSFMEPYVAKNPRSAYLCYRDVDIGTNSFGKASYEEGKVYGVKFFNNNFDRLVKIKTAVDPDNFFRNEQSIINYYSALTVNDWIC
ncbi:hypothetical protein KIW84_014552 [Lathyrus oleraceus]|uniref:FAD-binding PCMH-type domain-containing protein n=1 Tax=Pisum sativum TaxID=3888 RepID=A0A9D5BNE2_PEA|nr:hypothetical protein KIW84_014552 [Pisum sativum]